MALQACKRETAKMARNMGNRRVNPAAQSLASAAADGMADGFVEGAGKGAEKGAKKGAEKSPAKAFKIFGMACNIHAIAGICRKSNATIYIANYLYRTSANRLFVALSLAQPLSVPW